jgi:hypothetical protein
MKLSTLNTLLDRLIASESNNAVLREKNIGLNARLQSVQSDIIRFKREIAVLKAGVDITGDRAVEVKPKKENN